MLYMLPMLTFLIFFGVGVMLYKIAKSKNPQSTPRTAREISIGVTAGLVAAFTLSIMEIYEDDLLSAIFVVSGAIFFFIGLGVFAVDYIPEKIVYWIKEKNGNAKRPTRPKSEKFSEDELTKILKQIREAGYVSGAGAIPGGMPTLSDRAQIELANAIYWTQKRLNKFTISLVVLTIVLAILTFVNIIIVVLNAF